MTGPDKPSSVHRNAERFHLAELSEKELGSILCRLADPENHTHNPAADILPLIIDAAMDHGVGSIVYRKLAGRAEAFLLADLKREVEGLAALSLVHSLVATRIRSAIGTGAKATIVKGPVFAARLYPMAADRPFTDLDLLVETADHPEVSSALERGGFRRIQKAFFDRSEASEEQKWVLPEISAVLVELHSNLVHYPALRRKVTFGYAQLAASGEGNPEAPLALFFTAIVHASLGHKFHQLRMLVDVLQAWRKLGQNDRQSLSKVARALGAEMETALCLKLVSDLFELPDAGAVAASLVTTPATRAALSLVDAPALLAAPHSRLSWLRRHAFRFMQHLPR